MFMFRICLLSPVPPTGQASSLASGGQLMHGAPDTSSHVHLPGRCFQWCQGLPSRGCDDLGDLMSSSSYSFFYWGSGIMAIGSTRSPDAIGCGCRLVWGTGGVGQPPPEAPHWLAPCPPPLPGQRVPSLFPLRFGDSFRERGMSGVWTVS